MDKKHRGALSELHAVAWLLEQGYEVFRNVSQHGPADIIAVNFDTGERLFIDVKSAVLSSYCLADGNKITVERGNSYNRRTDAQKQHGVKILLVRRSGECFWAVEAS